MLRIKLDLDFISALRYVPFLGCDAMLLNSQSKQTQIKVHPYKLSATPLRNRWHGDVGTIK